IDPVWLSNLDIPAKILPQTVLRTLASAPAGFHATSSYETWRQVRYAQATLPGALGLLASALSLVLIPYEVRLLPILAITLADFATTSRAVDRLLGRSQERRQGRCAGCGRSAGQGRLPRAIREHWSSGIC